MTLRARLIRAAINLTPEWIVRLVTNFILKEIAELTFFHFDLDARKLYVEVQLAGESETIQIWMEDFYFMYEEDFCTIGVGQARANRIWLTNILSRIVGRSWKVPAPPQFAEYLRLLSEIFQPRIPGSKQSH
jgi:hypothetical protein